MLDWLIIGGGLHGVHCATVLLSRGGVDRDRLRILDPHPQPLARWRGYTANSGMDFLRSPEVHNLDVDPMSLYHFARSTAGQPYARFLNPYNRPALALFHAHTDWLVQRYALMPLWQRGEATGLYQGQAGLRVETSAGLLIARQVLLAIGPSVPLWPAWSQALRKDGATIDHIFEPHFNRALLPPWQCAVVVGGGITAAQTALAMARVAPGTVTLLSRHPLRVHQFDSDPCWIGPKCQNDFYRNRQMARRRALIHEARHRGSLPPDVLQALDQALGQGLLRHYVAEVLDATVSGQAQSQLRLAGDLESLTTDRLVLATGFDPSRPGGPWLTQAIDTLGLACSACGYPVVDRRLCWHPGLYVTGALSELELGPVARNIIGARQAATRLLTAA